MGRLIKSLERFWKDLNLNLSKPFIYEDFRGFGKIYSFVYACYKAFGKIKTPNLSNNLSKSAERFESFQILTIFPNPLFMRISKPLNLSKNLSSCACAYLHGIIYTFRYIYYSKVNSFKNLESFEIFPNFLANNYYASPLPRRGGLAVIIPQKGV